MLPLALGLGEQQAAVAVHIEARAGEPVLVLTPPMEAALRRFDPGVTIRRLSDYPPYMWRPGCTWSPERVRGVYQLKPREARFAVVGDFNGDRIPDVVMDGDNLSSGRRIVLLSNHGSFSASEVDSFVRIAADIEASRATKGAQRAWENGVSYGLSLVRPGLYRSPYETQALTLKSDAFIVSWFEKAAVLFYLRNGEWASFTLSD